MVNKQLSRNNNKYSLIALKIFIVIIFIFSSLLYGCQREKKSVLFWEETYYYDIETAKEAINNSANKKLDSVTELSTPLFNNSLLIIVPSQEMANWAKGEKHSNEAIRIILETGLQMYASAIKKHNMLETVVIISSDERTIDRTLFDYTLYVDGLEPRTDSPMWVINKTEQDIKMPFQLATEDFFASESLNEAVNNLKNTIIKIDEIISSMKEYNTIEKFMK
jgi:hypothetical protein